MCEVCFTSFGIFSFGFSTAAAADVGGADSFCTYTKFFIFIFRLMRYTDVCFFSLSGVLFPRE